MAIDSKRGAKDLFYKILEVNGNKNYYENESKIFWDGEPFESEGIMVLFQEDDRFIMKLTGDKHNYEIENQQYYDKLTIDGELVYELKNLDQALTLHQNLRRNTIIMDQVNLLVPIMMVIIQQ